MMIDITGNHLVEVRLVPHDDCEVTGGFGERSERRNDRLDRVFLAEIFVVFFSSRRRHTRFDCDWSSDVCSSDLTYDPMNPVTSYGGNVCCTGDAVQAGSF